MSAEARRRSAVEMIALALVCGGLWQGAVFTESWSGEQLRARDDTMLETARLAASLERIEAQRAAFSEVGASRALHDAASPATAAARVQALLDDLARAADVPLGSVQSLGTRDVAGVPAVAFRLEGEAPFDRWMALIADLEHFEPPLVIEAAMLRRIATGTWSAHPQVYAQLHLFAPIGSTAEPMEREAIE